MKPFLSIRHSSFVIRILLLTFSFCILHSAVAQLQFINLTSTTTNTTTSSANITIPGVCSNATYYVTNYNNVIVGDTIAAAFAKMNSDLAYCSNEFGLLINLPNQINTNWQSYSVGLSNFVANVGLTNSQISSNLTLVSSNFLIVSNNFTAISNRFVIISNNFVVVSNNFATVSNTVSRFFATNAPLHLPDIYDVSNKVGILQPSPAYALDVNGPIHFTGGSSSAGISMVLGNDGVGTMLWNVYNGATAQPVRFGLAGTAGFFASSGGGYVYFDSTQAQLGHDGGPQEFSVNSSGGMDVIDASSTGLHLDGSGHFINDQSFSSDGGTFSSDGSGNVTCTSLTQTSDANTKTNITALDPALVLQKLTAIPVYRWTFRDYTTTNSSSSSTTNAAIGAPGTAPAGPSAIITRHILSTTPHFGPMAQDWSGKFGGRTNGISVIDMQGLLLAGLQALSQQSNTFTNATGAKFHLIVNTATNGFVFVAE